MRNGSTLGDIMVRRTCWAWIGLVGLAACGADGDGPMAEDDIGRVQTRIVNGEPAPDPVHDAVVLLQNAKVDSLCTGVILSRTGEPVVVLTARHCVSKVRGNFECKPSDILYDYDVTGTEVRTGSNAQTVVGKGARAFFETVDQTGICNNDFAVLLLDSTNQGIEPVRLRVDPSSLYKGEVFAAVGYGARKYPDPYGQTVGDRYLRNDVTVTHIGPMITTLYSREFLGTEGMCDGDSGGPALTPGNDLIGIASRMSGCVGGVGLWTRVDKFLDVVDDAFREACASYEDEHGQVHPTDPKPGCPGARPGVPDTEPDAGEPDAGDSWPDGSAETTPDAGGRPEGAPAESHAKEGGCVTSRGGVGAHHGWPLGLVLLGIAWTASRRRGSVARGHRTSIRTPSIGRTR